MKKEGCAVHTISPSLRKFARGEGPWNSGVDGFGTDGRTWREKYDRDQGRAWLFNWVNRNKRRAKRNPEVPLQPHCVRVR